MIFAFRAKKIHRDDRDLVPGSMAKTPSFMAKQLREYLAVHFFPLRSEQNDLMKSYKCNTMYDYKYNINHKTDRKNDGTRIFYLKKQLRKLYMWFISLLFL